MGVDANQGYTIDGLDRLMGDLVRAEVALIEQPLARGREADLQGFSAPIPIAADESVLSLEDVPGLVGRFNIVNIKLDKCGGLTEGLAMAAQGPRARARCNGGQHGRHESRDGARAHPRVNCVMSSIWTVRSFSPVTARLERFTRKV